MTYKDGPRTERAKQPSLCYWERNERFNRFANERFNRFANVCTQIDQIWLIVTHSKLR